MDCNAYRILITGYIDGELSDDEMQMLKTHLQTCKSCFAYLIRAEAMKTVLKRCRLLQEVPEVPPNFARNISVLLREAAKKEKFPFSVKLRAKYREFVLSIIERWVSSLKTRPFAWMTSISLLVILIAGVVFIDILRTIYQERSIQSGKAPPTAVMRVAQKSEAPGGEESFQFPEAAPELEKREESYTQIVVEDEPIRYIEIIPESTTLDEKRELGSLKEGTSKQSPVIEASRDRLKEDTKVIEVDEDSFVRSVKSDGVSVEGYVYSHVIEVSQDQFIVDAVFVGYVQDAFSR